eukprot:m.110568 g.110568  ORF g.110568 m.110568 type:complete len:65 (-) comp21313_c0_seq1:357-551(-)
MLVCFVVVDGVAGVDAADVVEHSTTLTLTAHSHTHTLSLTPPLCDGSGTLRCFSRHTRGCQCSR